MKFCQYCGKELEDNQTCDCQEGAMEAVKQSYNNTNQAPVSSGSMVGCYLTAIVYPLLFVILAVCLYNWGETSIIGMLAAIIMDIAAAVIIILGGFYFWIIPLPIISIYKVGCLKPYLPTWKKVVFGILSFVLLFGSIGIMFLFYNI